MNMNVTIAENGTIFSWNVAGIDVLAPYTEGLSVTDARGGVPLCVPMFSVQQREVFGSHLPLHGILIYESFGGITTLHDGGTWERIIHFEPSASYNWKWEATLTIVQKEHSLSYTITVTRSPDCKNEVLMPLSLGFHPYFNTFGSDFSYEIAGHTTHKKEILKNIIDSAFAPLIRGESARLITDKGTLTITPEGYDEYCLWTDNIDTYFCIEPIFQYREYGLPATGLEKGDSHKTKVTLDFLAKPLIS